MLHANIWLKGQNNKRKEFGFLALEKRDNERSDHGLTDESYAYLWGSLPTC